MTLPFYLYSISRLKYFHNGGYDIGEIDTSAGVAGQERCIDKVHVKDAVMHCVLSNEIVGYRDFISYVWLYDTTLSTSVHSFVGAGARVRDRSASPPVPFHTGKKVLLFAKIAPGVRQSCMQK